MVYFPSGNTYNVAPIPDDFTGVCPGVVDHSASLTHPFTKRSKLYDIFFFYLNFVVLSVNNYYVQKNSY